MLKAGITIGCAAAMVVAAGLAVRLRRTRRTPSPLSGTEPFREQLAVTVGRSGGMHTPVALAVAFCLATLVLFGATFGVLVDRLAPRWPRPAWSPRGVVSVLPFAVLLLAPPLFIAAVIGVLAGTMASSVRSPAARDRSVRPEVEVSTAPLPRILVMALGGVGSLSVVVASGQVLAL